VTPVPRIEMTSLLASIVESSDDAILSTSVDGVILSWNKGAERLYGYTAEEIVGRPVSLLVPADRMHEVEEILAKVRRGEAVDHFESFRIRRDGSTVQVSLTISPVRDASGDVAAASSIARDISERNRRKDLEYTHKQAVDAFRIKSAFLATMSHEIRTPMNGVIGMASLVLETDLDAIQRRYMLALRDAGISLMAIVDNILDVSRIEAGKLELEYVDTDLDDLVTSVVSLVFSPAQDKGLALRLDIAADVPAWVACDPLRLRQVLMNLADNAIKYSDVGTVTIAVAAIDGGRTRFSVADTGIGIDPSVRASLLDPFSKASRSTTRRTGGSGLGLAICAQLVEVMGGTLEYASRPGRGSTFWFDIALTAARAARPPEQVAEPGGGVPHEVAGLGARILLADDSDINRLVGVALLERLGYSVDVVADGVEALAAIQRTRYDAVLMDCLMPVMDGYEATARVRGLDAPARDTPIIAITASAMVGDRDKCIAAGMDDYLSKPIDPEELAAAVARCRPLNDRSRPVPRFAAHDPKAAGDSDGTDAEVVEGLQRLEGTIGSVAYVAVCAAFLRSCPAQVGELNDAVAAGDVVATSRLAHKLKGSMASLGAVRLSRLAAELESHDRGDDRLRAVLSEFDHEFARVQAILTRSA